jgi:hypothetical protein
MQTTCNHRQVAIAGAEFLTVASSFGNITSPDLTDEQVAALTMLANTSNDDPSLAALLRIL